MADFVPPAHDSASPFADMRGRHVAVRTPSLAEAKEFYVGKLGLETPDLFHGVVRLRETIANGKRQTRLLLPVGERRLLSIADFNAADAEKTALRSSLSHVLADGL